LFEKITHQLHNTSSMTSASRAGSMGFKSRAN